jgi:hypothetical protein
MYSGYPSFRMLQLDRLKAMHLPPYTSSVLCLHHLSTGDELFWRSWKTSFSYPQHPKAKSLGSDGTPCVSATRGLLQRAHIIAGRHRRIL